ncbi:hypothetical protein [Streptomyces sp. 135]|uniref:hypothetical protein n=1 Tax=Streptomyces sp. 135 TaxID=2838850 RepID=UPI001CBAD318|nr:hypothetical protein [Streptomyces sp. 135]
MPRHAPNHPVCRHCDGFPVVSITTGDRHRDGTRVTVQATCRTCNGTGHATPASLARTGW